MRASTHLTGQHVLRTLFSSNTSITSWINAFGGFQTHPGQSRCSLTPWLRSGRISILGKSVGLSDACLGVVERAFRHVGIIPAINQYGWMKDRNLVTNIYLDYHFAFRHDFGNLSSNHYSPFALAFFVSFAPDMPRHVYKQTFLNLKHSSSSYAMMVP